MASTSNKGNTAAGIAILEKKIRGKDSRLPPADMRATRRYHEHMTMTLTTVAEIRGGSARSGRPDSERYLAQPSVPKTALSRQS